MTQTYKVGDTLPDDSLTPTDDRDFMPGELVAVREYTSHQWSVRTYVGEHRGKHCCRIFDASSCMETKKLHCWDQFARLPQAQTAEATFKSTVQTLLDEDMIDAVRCKVDGGDYFLDKNNFSTGLANINQAMLGALKHAVRVAEMRDGPEDGWVDWARHAISKGEQQ